LPRPARTATARPRVDVAAAARRSSRPLRPLPEEQQPFGEPSEGRYALSQVEPLLRTEFLERLDTAAVAAAAAAASLALLAGLAEGAAKQQSLEQVAALAMRLLGAVRLLQQQGAGTCGDQQAQQAQQGAAAGQQAAGAAAAGGAMAAVEAREIGRVAGRRWSRKALGLASAHPLEGAPAHPAGLHGADCLGLLRASLFSGTLHPSKAVFNAAFPDDRAAAKPGGSLDRLITLYAHETAAPGEPLRCFDGIRMYITGSNEVRMSRATALIRSLSLPPGATRVSLWRLPDGRLVVSSLTEGCGGAQPAASGARLPAGSSTSLATSDADLPECLKVTCNEVSGTLLPDRMVVVCGCPSCSQLGQGDPARTFRPTPWECHCGAGAYKKWNKSIKAVLPDGGSMPLHTFFLRAYGVTFTRGTRVRPPGKVFGSAADS
ncbi:hypothetical protein TSOC_013964, partial [Tetrabaena socialis]